MRNPLMIAKNVFRSPLSGDHVQYELDPVVAEVLAVPAAKEDALLDFVRETGGDEGVQQVAVMAVRGCEALDDAYNGSPPAELRKALRSLIGEDESAKPVTKTERTKMTETRPKRTLDETLAELRRVEKANQRYFDKHAEADLMAAAERIRKASGYSLTKPQAVAKALDEHPDLYAAYQRDLARRQGVLDDHPDTIAKAEAAEARLNRAAEAVLRNEPNLTHAQAVVKALEANPKLYEELP